VEYAVQSDPSASSGFGILLLKPEPSFPGDHGELSGFRPDFNGVGVFLYRSHTKRPGKWFVITLHNRGLMKMPDLEELILPAISCAVDVERGARGGIRLRMMKDLLEVEVRHANGDASYNVEQVCSREHVFVNQGYAPYFGVVAGNTDKIVNDIDLLAIYVKNLDEKRYTDKSKLEQDKLRYLLKKHRGSSSSYDESREEEEEEDLHPHDLLAMKLQDDVKRQQRASLTYLD
jgi:hypothetical protein